jgi:hypothetical protein
MRMSIARPDDRGRSRHEESTCPARRIARSSALQGIVAEAK